MTITSMGYTGSIGAGLQLALWQRTFAGQYGVVGAGDLRVTAVAGVDRTVSVAPGVCWGKGVRDASNAAQTVQLTTCSSGTRYDLIVVHRNSSGAGATTLTYVTGTTSQTGVFALRSTFEANTSLDDQPIALVPVVGGTGGGVLGQVIDLRCWVGTSGAIALSTLVLQYITGIGTQVRIGGAIWTRVVDSNLVETWDPAAAEEYAIGGALDGSAGPGGTTVLHQSGTTSVTSNSTGDAQVPFPVAFPAGLLAVGACVVSGVGVDRPAPIFAALWPASSTNPVARPDRTGFWVSLFGPSGNPWASATVQISWLATGW